MLRAALAIGAAVIFLAGLFLSPLALMGIGYGTPAGYSVALLSLVMIVVGTVGVLGFFRRSN